MSARDDSDLEVTYYRRADMTLGPIWIGKCCREWPMSGMTDTPGRCGICGESPAFVRWDDA